MHQTLWRALAAAALALASAATPAQTLTLRTLSSPATWVSGGDARIEIGAPAALQPSLQILLNGRRISPALVASGDRLEGVVDGLAPGPNRLELRVAGRPALRAALVLVNHPLTGPMFSGPQQQPFVCTTNQGAVGRQPMVDSISAPGYQVTDGSGAVVGYSRNCSIDPFVSQLYRATDNSWKPLPAGGRPADMTTVTLADGRTVDFVVRREIGSINRFLYSIAMLAPAADNAAQNDTGHWNRRLVYWFQGGVAIGHSQGTVHSGSMNPDLLARGYAIVHSSGNNTGTHYNMTLAGETAMMTKERFVERYGVPLYTVGLGGSGGAIQQYLLAQNQPGVLDALLPVQSYPDMVTQTIHVGDCELLEHYMDATDRANPKWRVTKNRSWLVGFNAEEGNPVVDDPLAPLKTQLGYATAVGSTECVKSWRGLTPLAMNPTYGAAPNQEQWEPQSDIAAIRWTHYDDLRNVYLVERDGAARATWDNVGVQYGLRALRAGRLTPAEFIHLNWHVGGWQAPSRMVAEGFPFFGTSNAEITKALTVPGYFDPWSARNKTMPPADAEPAPRTRGDFVAQRRAYTTGHVFAGRLSVPVIDHRQYLERELDMHNVHQSFATRARLLKNQGHADNVVVWFTDTMPGQPKASQTLDALAVMDEWMGALRANPAAGVLGNKPARAVDSCFDLQGRLIASGSGVWDGILDTRPAGACTQRFPLYTSSRIEAGAPIDGGIYRCALKPVAAAIADGSYGAWSPTPEQQAQLERIFPSGVCDYTRPDLARPGRDRP